MMENLQANIETYDSYYSRSRWWFRWRYDTQIKRKTALALLRISRKDWSGATIFELGFGSGDLLFSFPTDCALYGLELSVSAVTQALARAEKRGYTKFGFFTAQALPRIPLENECADLAIASHVLEHVEDDESFLREMHRILKKGSSLAVLIPINERFHDRNHLRSYTSESLKKVCQRCGYLFVHGFENELLYYLVEKLYWEHQNKKWTLLPGLARIVFNLLTAPLPYRLSTVLDSLIRSLTSLPPRQAALLFVKE